MSFSTWGPILTHREYDAFDAKIAAVSSDAELKAIKTEMKPFKVESELHYIGQVGHCV